MTAAWIGLGSNQGQSEAILNQALQALDRLPSTHVADVSSIYKTPPWGLADQADFLNAAAKLETGLAPEQFLDGLLTIEQELGRTRDGPRWGPRSLDLDLLLFDDQIVDRPRLQVPHPRLHLRAFVLVPLSEIEPGLCVPGLGTVSDLLNSLDPSECAGINLDGPLDYNLEP